MSVPARTTIVGLALAAGLAFAVTPAHAASCVTGAMTTTCTFGYTGASEDWVVPAGVKSAVFDAYGAQGGDVAPYDVWPYGQLVPGGSGGKGAHVQATLVPTPGATLHLRVGGRGDDGLAPTGGGEFTVAGGFNGGGTNIGACGPCGGVVLGGAGGGSTDVRTSGDLLADRLLVAGGGGGAGVGSGSFSGYADAGDGGDSATAAKSVTNDQGDTCTGGEAGTLVGPGAGGFRPPGSGWLCVPGVPGAAGGLNGGGNPGFHYSGAGGGGYFGGGAGAHTWNRTDPASGGGGGSDFPDPLSPPPGISNVTVTDGVQTGDGVITVTYATPTAVTFASASATRTARGILVRWRTGTEADQLGFHIYRSRGLSWRRLTRSLILAKGSVSGGSYRFLDRTARRGVAFRYRIKAVNLDGTTAWFGPVRVT